MKIIGCDYHPSGQQVFGIETETGGIFADQWIAHHGNEVDEFYGQLRAGTVVGVESSGNRLWFERKLAQYGHRVRNFDVGTNALDSRLHNYAPRPAAVTIFPCRYSTRSRKS